MTRKKEREKAAKQSIKGDSFEDGCIGKGYFIIGAEWADKTAWKPADGDNLPEIDREVIALVEENGYYKVVFAHRPNPNGDAICYDKGGWNMPDIRYWLDLELPKMEE